MSAPGAGLRYDPVGRLYDVTASSSESLFGLSLGQASAASGDEPIYPWLRFGAARSALSLRQRDALP